jgi:hypothetical protein
MKFSILSLTLAAFIGMTMPAMAEHPAKHHVNKHHPNASHGVNHRQHNQHDRMKQGVRSGELTREEAQTLRGEQRDIRVTEREYKSDGVLTRDERKDLHQEQNQASQNIYEEKHDAEQR